MISKIGRPAVLTPSYFGVGMRVNCSRTMEMKLSTMMTAKLAAKVAALSSAVHFASCGPRNAATSPPAST